MFWGKNIFIIGLQKLFAGIHTVPYAAAMRGLIVLRGREVGGQAVLQDI